MKYKYSICHIDRPEVEYKKEILSSEQVLEIVNNYPWNEELQREKKLPQKDLHYSPSLDFTNMNDNHSFCLTAEGPPENVSFSAWYNRPVMKNVLFGLLGKKERLDVIEKWIEKERAFELLHHFLKQEYQIIEKEMNDPNR